jgi:N-acetyl-gamma-glutamylphosphate reductase
MNKSDWISVKDNPPIIIKKYSTSEWVLVDWEFEGMRKKVVVMAYLDNLGIWHTSAGHIAHSKNENAPTVWMSLPELP